MQHRTSLPVLLSTLFLWTLSIPLGCGGNTGNTGGAGGTGGTDTGGTATGGTSTGGTSTGGTSTGGTSTGGTGGTGGTSTGGTGGAPPACETPTWKTMGCIESTMLAEGAFPPIDVQVSGVVTAVRPPDPGEACASDYWYHVGWLETPEVIIDLTLGDGTPFKIALAMPGLSQAAVEEGDTLDVKFAADMIGFGGRAAALHVERDGALVAAIGENKPAGGLTPGEGPQECYTEDGLCGRADLTMQLSAPDGTTVSIANGETANVGDLVVTSDRYVHNYDISGGCNFGASIEHIMSVTPAQ